VSIPAPRRAWRSRSLAGHVNNGSSPRATAGTDGERRVTPRGGIAPGAAPTPAGSANASEVAAWRLMGASIGRALGPYAEAIIGHGDALPRLSSRLVRVRAGQYAKGRLRSWIRQMNRGGHLRTVILRAERRRSAVRPCLLTTSSDLREFT